MRSRHDAPQDGAPKGGQRLTPVRVAPKGGPLLTALVTGGSSGIGRAIARELAARGTSLVLVSERKNELREARRDIERSHPVRIEVLEADLSTPGGADRVFRLCEGRSVRVDVLVNCAGTYANVEDEVGDAASAARLLELHVQSLTKLCLLFGRRMIERKLGYILNISSISAFFQDPSSLTYGASKRYILSLSKALHASWRGHNVKVCCLIPGGVKTGFFRKNRVFVPSIVSSLLITPERCAAIGLRALFKGRRRRVAGLAARIHLALFWLMLRPWFYPLAKRAYLRQKGEG
jgi:short-subunit dehydrogenase